jgi:PBP1b-binding outer membrane lipoprotein LpoB
MKIIATVVLMVLLSAGCTTHKTDSNQKMMDKVIGELDRETAK